MWFGPWKCHQKYVSSSGSFVRVSYLQKKLRYRISGLSTTCAWCIVFDENVEHIFWSCEVANWVWAFMGNWWSITHKLTDIREFLLKALISCVNGNITSKPWRLLIAASCWTIWLARKEVIFKNQRLPRNRLSSCYSLELGNGEKNQKLWILIKTHFGGSTRKEH